METTVCLLVPDHRVYLRKTVAPKSGQRHDHVPEQAFRNTQTRSVRRCADIVKVNVRFDCVHRPDIATPGPQRATGRPPPQNLVVEGHMIQVANEMGVPVPLREIPIRITIIITDNNKNVTDHDNQLPVRTPTNSGRIRHDVDTVRHRWINGPTRIRHP